MQVAPQQVASVITRSTRDNLVAPDFFMWATGIEDTFITDPHRRTGRILDEYELTQHYSQWQQDLQLIASLGVQYARYGVPWYRVEPAPGRFDFSWIDRVFDRMLELGINPIVDLMHYGTPEWLSGGYGNPGYHDRVAEYGARVADRYRGRIFWYTPLNEPRITAYYCGRIGWWPPYGRNWSGFVRVMLAICRGIVQTQRAIEAIDPEIVFAHVDATDLYNAAGPGLSGTAEWRQDLVFLALDLVTGRIHEGHRLWAWLRKNGADEAALEWFAANSVMPDLIGINLYPMFSDKVVLPGRVRMRYGSADLLEKLARLYWERYGRPIFVSETAAVGRRRATWLRESLEAVRRLREAGVPMCGYTWWPLFALVAWAYREKDLPFERYLIQMGLWDLSLDDSGHLARIATPVAQKYSEAVRAGVTNVGKLRRPS